MQAAVSGGHPAVGLVAGRSFSQLHAVSHRKSLAGHDCGPPSLLTSDPKTGRCRPSCCRQSNMVNLQGINLFLPSHVWSTPVRHWANSRKICRKKVDCTRRSTIDFLGLILPFLNISFSLSASFSSLIVFECLAQCFPPLLFSVVA